MKIKNAIIIGAGPAGLTAAYELLKTTDIKPIIYEMSTDIGGISKTTVYKGNRIDIGGHRFFSKSSRVMEWWQNIMPLQEKPAYDDALLNRKLPLSKREQGPTRKRPILSCCCAVGSHGYFFFVPFLIIRLRSSGTPSEISVLSG